MGAQHEQPSIPHLAAELTDMIIDHLHDDKASLSNCSVVSRQWLDASQHHLFHTVRLVGVTSQWGVDSFLQLLERIPRLSQYVRTLEVLGDRWYSPHQHIKASCLGPTHLAAFMSFPCLRNLTFTSTVWDSDRVAQMPMLPCSLDTLTLSHFTSFGSGAASLKDVLAVITPFSAISKLRLLRTNVTVDPIPNPILHLPSSMVRLQALSLGPVPRSSTLYSALSRIRFCSTIQSVKIEMGDWSQASDIAVFMRDAAQNVMRLELDVSSCRSIWLDVEPEMILDGEHTLNLPNIELYRS